MEQPDSKYFRSLTDLGGDLRPLNTHPSAKGRSQGAWDFQVQEGCFGYQRRAEKSSKEQRTKWKETQDKMQMVVH